MAPDHLPLRRPEREAALPYRAWDGPQRFPGGDDDDRQDEQTQRERACEHARTSRYRRQELYEDAKTKQAVDNRRDPCKVGDVDLDYPVDARVLGVLLE